MDPLQGYIDKDGHGEGKYNLMLSFMTYLFNKGSNNVQFSDLFIEAGLLYNLVVSVPHSLTPSPTV